MNPEWWHWAVGGIALVLLELAIPSFFIIWFGIGAVLVALTLLVVADLSVVAQLGVWIVASVAMTILWFQVFRTDRNKTLAGTSAGDVIGEVGLLVAAVAPFERGRVRFQRPVLGSEEWVCLADLPIPAGERVRVVSIEGSFVKIVRA